ncbi:MAG: response regulator [Rhodobacter sp.]|nr:response regulator [Rhodobacter sp.]
MAPLVRLAPRGSALALIGAAVLAVAVAAGQFGAQTPALLASAAGVTALVLGLAATVAGWRVQRHQGRVSTALAGALAGDPDPVLLTDSQGSVRAANQAAAGGIDLAARLDPWCVDAPDVVAALLAEALRRGHAKREFWRKDSGLRLSLHGSDAARDLLIWHFSPLARGGARDLDVLGVPTLTRGDGQVHGNSDARALTGPADLDTLWDDAVGHARSGDLLVLPDGSQVQPLHVPARDGFEDILLLPPLGAPRHGGDKGLDPESNDIPVALVQLDPEGRIHGANRLARTLLALMPEESRFFWEVVEGLGRPVSDWLDDARAGRALGRPEVLRAALTGPETYVQIILRRAPLATSAPGSLVAVISDATELKSLEARFVQSQKMQAIGQLAGGIAHDFNNLLTAISGHCDLLLLNRDRFDPDYNDLLQIHQNANRAAALVRQLLAFSRKQTLKPEVMTLESMLEDLTHLLTRLVGERITLALTNAANLGAIRADRRQLEQVIMNLVVNARDAMPMGGTIALTTEPCHLDTELEHGRARVPPGDYAVIRVVDQGIGIPADIIDKIFEPFFTTKRLGEGTGLGLSTAYGIVKQMGGYIFCDSVEGAGTTFTLYFAIDISNEAAVSRTVHEGGAGIAGVPGSDSPRPPPVPSLDPPARGGSILLVEDEAPVRAFAARALRLQGYQVFEAQDGEQALEFLENPAVRVDLFVTDVIMPGIDGPGWVTEALQTRPGTPVVFVSGYTEDALNAALVRIPQSRFLGKPFSLQELCEAIETQLVS